MEVIWMEVIWMEVILMEVIWTQVTLILVAIWTVVILMEDMQMVDILIRITKDGTHFLPVYMLDHILHQSTLDHIIPQFILDLMSQLFTLVLMCHTSTYLHTFRLFMLGLMCPQFILVHLCQLSMLETTFQPYMSHPLLLSTIDHPSLFISLTLYIKSPTQLFIIMIITAVRSMLISDMDLEDMLKKYMEDLKKVAMDLKVVMDSKVDMVTLEVEV